LDGFFSLLSSDKKTVTDVIEEATEIINTEATEEIISQTEEVIDVVREIEQVIEQAITNIPEEPTVIEPTIDAIPSNTDTIVPPQPPVIQPDSDAIKLKKVISDLDKRLTKEVEQLKKLITLSNRHNSSGGGEVRFERLDDVNLNNKKTGDAIVYDSITKSFTNVPIKLAGGTTNQVLVKLSASDYDYEWQDVIISPQLNQQVYTKLIDDTTPSITYIGEAVPLSITSGNVWRIQKIVFDSSGNVDSIKFAGTGIFDQIWNLRTTLSYT